MVRPGRYKSRLFNATRSHAQQWASRTSRLWRHLKSAAVWGTQVALYPIYCIFQASRLANRQLQGVVQRRLLLQQGTANTDRSQRAPSVDAPLRHMLGMVRAVAGAPLTLARRQSAQLTARTSERSFPGSIMLPSAPGSSTRAAVSTPLVAANPATRSAVHRRDIRGFACTLASRRVVLVTRHNQVLDLLTAEQQTFLQSQIAMLMAQYWRRRRTVDALTRPFFSHIQVSPARKAAMLLPVRALWSAMAWVQTQPLAVATNLFGEARLLPPTSAASDFDGERRSFGLSTLLPSASSVKLPRFGLPVALRDIFMRHGAEEALPERTLLMSSPKERLSISDLPESVLHWLGDRPRAITSYLAKTTTLSRPSDETSTTSQELLTVPTHAPTLMAAIRSAFAEVLKRSSEQLALPPDSGASGDGTMSPPPLHKGGTLTAIRAAIADLVSRWDAESAVTLVEPPVFSPVASGEDSAVDLSQLALSSNRLDPALVWGAQLPDCPTKLAQASTDQPTQPRTSELATGEMADPGGPIERNAMAIAQTPQVNTPTTRQVPTSSAPRKPRRLLNRQAFTAARDHVANVSEWELYEPLWRENTQSSVRSSEAVVPSTPRPRRRPHARSDRGGTTERTTEAIAMRTPVSASREAIAYDPGYIDTSADVVGYELTPFQEVLAFIDRWLCRFEDGMLVAWNGFRVSEEILPAIAAGAGWALTTAQLGVKHSWTALYSSWPSITRTVGELMAVVSSVTSWLLVGAMRLGIRYLPVLCKYLIVGVIFSGVSLWYVVRWLADEWRSLTRSSQ